MPMSSTKPSLKVVLPVLWLFITVLLPGVRLTNMMLDRLDPPVPIIWIWLPNTQITPFTPTSEVQIVLLPLPVVPVPPLKKPKLSNKYHNMAGTIKAPGVIFPNFLSLIKFVDANPNAPEKSRLPNTPCIVPPKPCGKQPPIGDLLT